MTKVKAISSEDFTSKKSLKLLKQGAVQKKKNQKFKNTPGGKIALINGSKARNNSIQQGKGKAGSVPKSPDSPQTKNKKKKQQQQESSPQKLDSSIKELVPKDEESDSEEDINEGIVIEEELSYVQQEGTDNEEDDDDDDEEEKGGANVIDLLGASLADDTDEDDEDFEETEEDEEGDEHKQNVDNEVKQKKGVKMFKGMKSNNKNDDSVIDNSKQAKSDSDNNNSLTMEDDEDDSENEEFEAEREEDSEDIEGEEDDSENEEFEVEGEDSEDIEDEEEEDDEDEDEDEDEEEEENALGLQALLGNSIADDDDDEDFDGEEEDDEDEDISDEEEEEEGQENNSMLSTAKDSSANASTISADVTAESETQRDKRTIFVGNLPKTITKAQLIKLFKKFGPVETVRIRGAVPEKPNVPKKVAGITKKLHPQLKTVIAYIVFKSEDSVKPALSMNAKVYEGNHLRVDTIIKSEKVLPDPKKSVFLGNLSYKVDNNSIWEFFKDCGQIESVRVVRDNKTGVSKGIGYVNFTSEDAVVLALELNGTELEKREIRVKPCTASNVSEKRQNSNQATKRSHSNESANENTSKKFKNNAEAAVHRKKQKGQKSKEQNSSVGKQTFEGQKAEKKKKHKMSKDQKKKKFLAEKLMAKSKKPTK